MEYFESRSDGPWRRVVLEGDGQSGQVYLFAKAEDPTPEKDYWFETVEQAKACCRDEWGVPTDAWIKLDQAPDFLRRN